MVLFWNTILFLTAASSSSYTFCFLKTVRPLSLAFFLIFPVKFFLDISRANDYQKKNATALILNIFFVCFSFMLFNWMKLELMICRIYTVSSFSFSLFFSLFVIFALGFFFLSSCAIFLFCFRLEICKCEWLSVSFFIFFCFLNIIFSFSCK